LATAEVNFNWISLVQIKNQRPELHHWGWKIDGMWRLDSL